MPYRRLPTLRLLLSRVHLQLIVFAVVLATVSLMLSGAMVIHNYMATNLRLAADTVAYSAEPAMVFDDSQAMADSIAAIAGYPSVDKVELRDRRGVRVAGWTRSHDDARGWLITRLNSLIWARPTTADVRHTGEKIGTVLVYGNSGGILRFLVGALVIALACIGLSVLGTRILARHLQQGVIGPLEQVAQVAHAVREQRAFDKRVPSAGIAEIDRLGQDFNALLAELQTWHAGVLHENAELERQARHDQLTGLGNRASFERALQHSLCAAVPFSLIQIDIDGFKGFNADHGLESGDAALIAVAERLRTVLRDGDSAYRIGGDEFALLLPSVAARDRTEAVCDWIRVAMDDPMQLPNGEQVRLALGIGYASFPDDGTTIGGLLTKSDSAMVPRQG